MWWQEAQYEASAHDFGEFVLREVDEVVLASNGPSVWVKAVCPTYPSISVALPANKPDALASALDITNGPLPLESLAGRLATAVAWKNGAIPSWSSFNARPFANEQAVTDGESREPIEGTVPDVGMFAALTNANLLLKRGERLNACPGYLVTLAPSCQLPKAARTFLISSCGRTINSIW